MADFCTQCAVANGDSESDFAYLAKVPDEVQPGYGWLVLCEGCGPAVVRGDGTCIDPGCFMKHGLAHQEAPA